MQVGMMININEKSKNEHQLLDLYTFAKESPPTRFIRLLMTGKNWSDEFFLTIFHIDIFGTYIGLKFVDKNLFI